MNSRVEFRPEVGQSVAEATAWYDANNRCAANFVRKLFAFEMFWQKSC